MGVRPQCQGPGATLLKNPCGSPACELAHPLHGSLLSVFQTSYTADCSAIELQARPGLGAAILESPCLLVDLILCFQESNRFV